MYRYTSIDIPVYLKIEISRVYMKLQAQYCWLFDLKQVREYWIPSLIWG